MTDQKCVGFIPPSPVWHWDSSISEKSCWSVQGTIRHVTSVRWWSHHSLVPFQDPRGMVLELLQNAKAAASPPSFATVTRDALPCHGAPGVLYAPKAARQIAAQVSAAAEYLHSKGLMHGDTWEWLWSCFMSCVYIYIIYICVCVSV